MANTIKAMRIDIDGTAEDVTLDTSDILRAMYAQIGCDIVEPVTLTDRIEMWMDEEGMLTAPINVLATMIARRFGLTHQPYHGVALFTGGLDSHGETTGLSDACRQVLRDLVDELHAVPPLMALAQRAAGSHSAC